jgi:hypothetical protein
MDATLPGLELLWFPDSWEQRVPSKTAEDWTLRLHRRNDLRRRGSGTQVMNSGLPVADRDLAAAWMIQTGLLVGGSADAITLSVSLFDYFISGGGIDRDSVKDYCACALLIGTKFADAKTNNHLWQRISELGHDLQDVGDLEKQILRAVDFNVRLTTPLVFLRTYFRSIAEDSDAESITSLEKVVMFMHYCALSFGDCSEFGAEAIAVTCLFLGVRVIGRGVYLDSSLLKFPDFGKCAVAVFNRLLFVVKDGTSMLMPFYEAFRQPLLEFVTSVDIDSLIESATSPT